MTLLSLSASFGTTLVAELGLLVFKIYFIFSNVSKPANIDFGVVLAYANELLSLSASAGTSLVAELGSLVVKICLIASLHLKTSKDQLRCSSSVHK